MYEKCRPSCLGLNTLKPEQNGEHFADIFKSIFLIENCCDLLPISMKNVPDGPIGKKPALVQMMARFGTGDKPLSESMMS